MHRDCIQANGTKLDDTAFTAASWDVPLGAVLRVCRQRNVEMENDGLAACTVVRVTDRGPNRKLYTQGKILDLSPAAFDALGGKRGYTKTGQAYGEIAVTVEGIP